MNQKRTQNIQLIAGLVFGAMTLIFFMSLLVLSITKNLDISNHRLLIAIVTSFGGGLSAGFLAGNAAVNGTFGNEGKSSPWKFSATGGIALMVILFCLIMFLPIDTPHKKVPMSLELSMTKKNNEELDSVFDLDKVKKDDDESKVPEIEYKIYNQSPLKVNKAKIEKVPNAPAPNTFIVDLGEVDLDKQIEYVVAKYDNHDYKSRSFYISRYHIEWNE